MADLAVLDTLTPDQIASVQELISRTSSHDGVHPLSEHVWLHLRHGLDERSRHVLAFDGDDVVAYAHVDSTDLVQGTSTELAVDPAHRRQGLGRALLTKVMGMTPDGRLRLWAHGEQNGAGRLARAMGFTSSRVVWQMRRSLLAPIPAVNLPAGFTLRTFKPGRDDESWVAVNNRAFTGHPDQGSWSITDLHWRMAEPWFDADGFFLGIDDTTGGIAGFVWTKVHGPHSGTGDHESTGEAYVVGVDPDYQGRGLARALMAAALRFLRKQGLSQAMLYVDADATAAITLYEGLGFARWDTDVLYRTGA